MMRCYYCDSPTDKRRDGVPACAPCGSDVHPDHRAPPLPVRFGLSTLTVVGGYHRGLITRAAPSEPDGALLSLRFQSMKEVSYAIRRNAAVDLWGVEPGDLAGKRAVLDVDRWVLHPERLVVDVVGGDSRKTLAFPDRALLCRCGVAYTSEPVNGGCPYCGCVYSKKKAGTPVTCVDGEIVLI